MNLSEDLYFELLTYLEEYGASPKDVILNDDGYLSILVEYEDGYEEKQLPIKFQSIDL